MFTTKRRRPDGQRQTLAARLQNGPMTALGQMHDSLCVLCDLEAVDGGDLAIRLDELRGWTEWVMDDINRAISTLSKDRFDDHKNQPGSNLFNRLRDLTEAFHEETGINCIFAVMEEHANFNSLAGEVVIRSINELLNNVERHAHATKVEVNSSLSEDGLLVFEVRDDGVGLITDTDPGTRLVGRGFGLWNIGLCLRGIGGFVRYTNDSGLSVRIVLPGHRRQT